MADFQSPRIDVGSPMGTLAQGTRRNHVYLVGELGHLYAYTMYPRGRIDAIKAVLQISLTGEAITTIVNGETYRTTAHLTQPAWIEIDSGDVPVACFVFYNYSEMYRSMRLLPEKFISLPRKLFEPFDRELRASITGELSITAARQLFMDVIGVLSPMLPPAPPTDLRIERVLSLLMGDCNLPIQDLANAVSLSPARLSHLFTGMVGISLRRQRLAIKLLRSIAIYRPGMSMSELADAAGFSDSAHLSRASTEIFGAPPSYFLKHTVVHF